jgi:tetratricopeptide (TPR) repeat protein
MGTKDDLITKHHEDQIDRNLTDKYRALNLWAEIGSMKKSDPDEDRLNTISGRLMRAEGMFEDVFKNKFTFSEVIYYVTEKILTLDPENARGLTIRAIANSELSRFAEAIEDTEAAIRAQPDDDSRSGQYIRDQLPFWREDLKRYGG